MVPQLSAAQLVEQKLAAFDVLQPEFETCFLFVESIHGQRRFASCSVSDVVRYFHALWICDCKTYLLSIARTVKSYDGVRCLDMLLHWQENGDCAPIVNFLYSKLDALPMGLITQQIEESRRDITRRAQTQRLQQGRVLLLNRGMNLLHLLDAMFVLSKEDLLRAVRETCLYYSHTPEQIAQQRERFSTPLYAYSPQQQLAQRNMLVMNRLGMHITGHGADMPGQRTARVEPGSGPIAPYAEEVILNYQELSSAMSSVVSKKSLAHQPVNDHAE
jgi:hypothetical protein